MFKIYREQVYTDYMDIGGPKKDKVVVQLMCLRLVGFGGILWGMELVL